jgi:drug/metabolite transporter (DMT)-like permease
MEKKNTFLALVITVVLWGSAFPGIRAALHTYQPVHLAALRFLVASLALGLVLWRVGAPRLSAGDVPAILLNGVVGVGFYNLFLNTGQKTVDSGAASLLVNTAPIWTMIWSVLFLKEHAVWTGWLGLVVSFFGVALIALRHGGQFELNHGALLVLGASIAHSIYIVSMKRNVQRYGPIGATTYAVWAGTAFLLFFSRGLISAVQNAPLSATLTVIYLGLFPAAVAYVFWGVVLTRFPASRAVSFLYFVPVAAFVIAWAWLGEAPSWPVVVGGVLIVSGVALVNLRKKV